LELLLLLEFLELLLEGALSFSLLGGDGDDGALLFALFTGDDEGPEVVGFVLLGFLGGDLSISLLGGEVGKPSGLSLLELF